MVVNEALYPENSGLPTTITAGKALRSAIESLERRGVREIRLCSIDWIVAAVGAANIYATGRWDHEGVHFESFFVSIHDGTEAKYGHLGGDEHFMLARGFDRALHETYYFTGGTTPRTLRYVETDDQLMFEYASRETLQNLRQTCGLRTAP